MKPWIEITISESGEVELEARGAKGRECLSLTEFLEKGLGDVQERKMKTDVFENRRVGDRSSGVANIEK